jgi:hypothetical protein
VYPWAWYYHVLCVSETKYQFYININHKLVDASDLLENSSPEILIMWMSVDAILSLQRMHIMPQSPITVLAETSALETRASNNHVLPLTPSLRFGRSVNLSAFGIPA